MGNLYHKDIYLPPGVLALTDREITFRVTEHARRAAREDRYGFIAIPASITFEGADVIEAEFEAGQLQKLVVRKPYDNRRDAIFVFNVDGTLKTVWANLKSDCHASLKKELYKAAPSV